MIESESHFSKITIQNALKLSNKRLEGISTSFRNDSRVLLCNSIDKPQSWLLAHPEEKLTSTQFSKFEKILSKLELGIPLPYVLGEWDFFGLTFHVNSSTLIPRPETEILVATALDWFNKNPDKTNALEIGSGTGCIPISIAVNHPTVKFTSVDLSEDALLVAQRNLKRHNIDNQIVFLQSDLFENVDGKFDLICSNPPYIPTMTLHNLKVFKKEPTFALDGGNDGLDIIRKILSSSKVYLNPKGLIMIEIEAGQGKTVQNLANSNFPKAQINVKKDLAGHDRLLVIQT